GLGPGDNLARLEAAGDVNGDGAADFLLRGTGTAYLLLGPVELSAAQTIDRAAAVLIDTASLGMPADRMGDVNGDGLGDLIFVNNTTHVITIIFGRSNLPRTLTAADTLDGKGVVLTSVNVGASFTAGNWNVSALQWDGDGEADLLLTTTTLSRRTVLGSSAFGFLFSGDQIRRALASTVLTPLATFSQDPLALSTIPTNAVSTLTGLNGILGLPLTTSPLLARVVGDVNGDGLDDVVFADPGFS